MALVTYLTVFNISEPSRSPCSYYDCEAGQDLTEEINVLWSKACLEMSRTWSGASHNAFKENVIINYEDENVLQHL